jgi:chitinase
VGVYQGQPVPSPGNWTSGDYWNFWVPILTTAISSIDLVQVQAYNNWYDGLSAGSLSFLQDVALQWTNKPSPFCVGCAVIPAFTGVPISKLAIGIPASSAAGTGVPTTTTIGAFQTWLTAQNMMIAGMMIWNSHWDSLNAFQISNSIIESGPPSPINPLPVPQKNVCTVPNSQASSSTMKRKLIK